MLNGGRVEPDGLIDRVVLACVGPEIATHQRLALEERVLSAPMGDKNSSLTRVQPVFNELLNCWPTGEQWVARLCEMAALTRPTASLPANIGLFVEAEVPRDPQARLGNVFERIVPAPTAFLRWLISNADQMQCSDERSFGSREPKVQEWRRKLLRGTAEERSEARAEGLKALEYTQQTRPADRQGKWWVFEGRSHIDCCLITKQCVLFVEGKRTESVSAATNWFAQRSQLWRNVEAVKEFAAGKQFGVILAVENEPDGLNALDQATLTLAGSYPHLDAASREELSRGLLGFVTWRGVVSEFGLDESCLVEGVPKARLGSPLCLRW